METLDFCEKFLDEVGGAWNLNSVLDLADQAQKEILGVDCDLMRIKPDPFFRTQQGVFDYPASTSLFESITGTPGAAITGSIRAIRKVYRSDRGWFGGGYGFAIPHFEYLTGYSGGSLYRIGRCEFGETLIAPVTGKDCIAVASNDARAIWNFRADPGDSTDTWQAEAYRWPNPLISFNVALEIPDDYQFTALWFNMLRRTERRNYGRADYTDAMYKRDVRELRGKYMGAAKETDQAAIPREA